MHPVYPPSLLPVLFSLLAFLTTTATSAALGHTNYAVVVDAGSSGTRVWVYKWQPVFSGLPKFDYLIKKKTNPGISESAEDTLKLREMVALMLEQAAEVVPVARRSYTPVYLLATAGMRYLLEDKATEVVAVINSLLLNTSINPFLYQGNNNIRILSGEEEGAFAWIAVNYMKGVFSSNSSKPDYSKTYGILEMGGASTQIAFVPKGPLLARLFPITIDGKRYSLYSNSYLHYGQDSVETWIKEYLVSEAGSRKAEGPLRNPCFNSGTDETYRSKRILGEADKNKCMEMMEKLVVKTHELSCHPKPCGVGTVYQPTISPEQKFYALSVYPLIFRELNLTTKEVTGPVSINDIYTATTTYCKKDYTSMKAGVPEKRHQYLHKPCYMGLYIARLLHDGFGFEKDTQNIHGLEKINGRNVDWTLGALIYETQTSNPFNHCPSTGFSIGSPGSSFKPSSAIFLLTIVLPVYKLFPLPTAIIIL